MSLPPLADVDALAAWLGVAIDAEPDIARAGAVLAAASAQIRRETGATYVDGDGNLIEDIPDEVVTVTVQLAARMWSNPTGATQESEGPFSVTHGRATLTDGERAVLSPTGGLGTIRVSAPNLPRPSPCWGDG